MNLGRTVPPTATLLKFQVLNCRPHSAPEAFAVLDKRVEEEFISNQNGFISRDSGISVDNEPRWVNIVKWETLLDADENIYQFTRASAPASVKEYLASIGAEPVELKRYQHTGA
jgi:hypothetical protein